MADDTSAQARLMIDGLIVLENSLSCTMVWAGSEIVCSAGPEFGGKRLDEGGYRLNAKLQIKVRTGAFLAGIGFPKEKQLIQYRKNSGADLKTYRITSVTDWWGAVLQLDCEDPNQSA